MFPIDRYQEFDSAISQITRIQVGCSLSKGQTAELREVAAEMEAARQEGSLDSGSYQRLLDTMADCGLDMRGGTARRSPRAKGRER